MMTKKEQREKIVTHALLTATFHVAVRVEIFHTLTVMTGGIENMKIAINDSYNLSNLHV